ncbi:MAG: hypothetical protein ACRCX2_20530 [Paraclostridium sp.]
MFEIFIASAFVEVAIITAGLTMDEVCGWHDIGRVVTRVGILSATVSTIGLMLHLAYVVLGGR